MRTMKDSGIEWIGEIPQEWKVTKCKYVSSFINGYAFDSRDLSTDYTYPVIRIGDIVNATVDIQHCLGVNNNAGLERCCVKENDILLAMSGATVGKIGIAHNLPSAYINQRVGIIRAQLPKFLFYCLLTGNFIEYVLLNSNSSAQPNISGECYGNFLIPNPCQSEQQKIADFLDAKCADIDTAISEAKASIEDYKLLKQSIITKAVTKGLNPNAEMKDSGIEWIGKVPKEWEIGINKVAIRNVTVKNHPNDTVLSLYRDYGVLPKDSRDDNHNVTSEKTEEYKYVEVGNLVINKMKAWQGSLAVSEYSGIVSPAYYVCEFINDDINKKYFHYFIRNKSYAQYFESISTGLRIGQWDLNIEDFLRAPLLIPPHKEQKMIAEYLDEKSVYIDTLISEKELIISELEAYKKSLIFEYVTGKKEVA